MPTVCQWWVRYTVSQPPVFLPPMISATSDASGVCQSTSQYAWGSCSLYHQCSSCTGSVWDPWLTRSREDRRHDTTRHTQVSGTVKLSCYLRETASHLQLGASGLPTGLPRSGHSVRHQRRKCCPRKVTPQTLYYFSAYMQELGLTDKNCYSDCQNMQ